MAVAVGTEAHDVVVEAVGLTKEYPAGDGVRRALAGVDLDIARGAFVSIMGPSGSGKSTLLHLLGGLDRPTAGEVRIEGRAVSGLAERDLTLVRRHTIGFVFQAYNLVPVLTAAENVALPLVIDGRRGAEADTAVSDALELVGLAERAGELPGRLSGGEQQRVAIARALVHRPAVLLADEPTGNLDTATAADILAVLRDARDARGQTVVVVTHDPKVASHGDEVVQLRDGLVRGRLDLTAGRQTRRPADRVISWLLDETSGS